MSMQGKILLGRGQHIMEIDQATWKRSLTQVPQHSQSRLGFMTDAHHQVRYYVVKELVDKQMPIEPDVISQALKMPLARVIGILEELEQKLFFLVRNQHGAVAWAYPLTVEATPHRLSFHTGKRLYGA